MVMRRPPYLRTLRRQPSKLVFLSRAVSLSLSLSLSLGWDVVIRWIRDTHDRHLMVRWLNSARCLIVSSCAFR